MKKRINICIGYADSIQTLGATELKCVYDPLVNEGPEVIVNKDCVNLVYSASGSWTDDYCLGLLTANVNSDLKDSSSWTKHDMPVLEKENDVYGPGITVSPPRLTMQKS